LIHTTGTRAPKMAAPPEFAQTSARMCDRLAACQCGRGFSRVVGQ
jgi:hypothetical protein